MVLRTALIVLRMHTQCKSELPDELRKINLTDEIEDRKIETLCFSRIMADRQSCLDDKALKNVFVHDVNFKKTATAKT